MLLDDLVTAIQTVQQRIREHGNPLSQNEYRTRLALIDPILNALGWDVSDPVFVTPEYQAGNGRADYALLGPDGNPRAFIEAKRLNEPLEAHQDQVFKYTWDQKLFYGGLTDGNRWILEDVTAAFSGRKGRLLDLTVSRQTAYQCALKLLLIWRPTFAAGDLIEANAPVLDTPTKPDPIIDPPPPSLEWVSLAEYKVKGGTKPTNIRLPDNSEVPLQYWYEILKETAEWLIRTGLLTKDRCPVKNNGKVSIVHTEPKHESGTDFWYPVQLSNGLFLNKHGTKETVLNYTKFLLEGFGKDPTSILLKPSQ